MLAGLLARGSGASPDLPNGGPLGFRQWHKWVRLTAYSCGGSHGLVTRTLRVPLAAAIVEPPPDQRSNSNTGLYQVKPELL